MTILQKIFISNTNIKIFSIILGYAFWHAIGQNQPTKICLDATICFYNLDETKIQNTKILCKNKAKIELFAKRADLQSIERNSLAFHINAENLKNGPQIIQLKEEQLFLPDSIKMVRCYPANVAIKIEGQ